MIKKLLKTGATTLLEIVIYFTIFGVILLVSTTFAIQILNVNKLSSNFNEVQSNISLVSNKVIAAIQEADSIDVANSVFDNDQGALTLIMPTPALSPTKFYLSSNNLYMVQGIGTPEKLNSTITEFNILRFHRVSYPKSRDQVVIDIRAGVAANSLQQLDKTLDSHFSISLRK